MRKHAIFLLTICIFAVFALAACTKPKQQPLPVGSLKLGLAYFTHPSNSADMLAGYLVENEVRIEDKVLNEMDALFSVVLNEESKNTFRGRERALKCSKTIGEQSGRSNNIAALRTWSAIGRCMGVDLLVVPQLLEYAERKGGEYGVTTPAKVVMDIFVIDVRNETLISRSRFDETQSALTDNLLDAGKFFKRSGKWISAHDLAREGMEKAIKELGL